MHNLQSVQENETYNVLWDFEKQMDRKISARRPDLMIVYKKENKKKENMQNRGIFSPNRPQGNIRRMQKER